MNIKRYQKKLCNDIQKYCKTITPTRSTTGLFNHRCFYNACDYAVRNGGDVVEVMLIQDQDPTLHYINRDADGQYVETTLGYLMGDYNYHLLRDVQPCDYNRIDVVFDDRLDHFNKLYIPWYSRPFIKGRLC